MEFLLFLCAALSALTGAITGSRSPDLDVQIERVSQGAGTVATAAVRTVAAIVWAQRAPALLALRNTATPRSFSFDDGISARGERRRE
ncbi:hypothetical protein [Sphingomonas sp. BAUL-RG-20F-R05-02]|uniref:hypothetical protein n=1 Tax=Sphingomonas sp. BAUL-RG-20F-R05-02 TaxID=2914830 RepID=UPI001F57BF64|nr:hypothetical protein [Sphingomonas sp. BAUL-RG-20F-R05-02]